MISEKRQIDNFNRVANERVSWALCGHSLITSSQILFSEYDKVDLDKLNTGDPLPPAGTIFDVVKMLRAMALECYLKALWVKSGGTLATDGKYITIPGTSNHDLLTLIDSLSDKVDLAISIEDLHLLKRLSLSISGGRYPIQRTWKSGKMQKLPNGGEGPLSCWTFPADEDLFASLVARIQQNLEA